MKICFIFSNFHLSHLTAQPGMVFKLANKVAERGEKIYIISNDIKNRNFRRGGIHFFLFKGLGDLRTYFFNVPKIIKYLKDSKPSIIHVHGSLLVIYAWLINRLFGIPLVCSLCETLDAMNTFYRKLLVFCLTRVEKIFLSSDYIKDQLVRNGVPSHKVLVIRIGLDEKFLVEMQNFSPDTDILYFGDSSRERGFDIIFQLARKLPQLKFKILLRWEGRNCSKELEKMKRLPNVTILYYPYSESQEQIILKSKLVVLPYRWMAVRPPLTLVEAMALGKCVITSFMEGNEEIVKNEYNGLIVNFNKLDDVISKIIFLIENHQVRENIGQKAKETIRQMYSSEEYNKILRCYSNLLKR